MNKKVEPEALPPTDFGPLVRECTRRGIGRFTAFKLVREGLLDTFTIGRLRYVRIASLESLPERLAERAPPPKRRRACNG